MKYIVDHDMHIHSQLSLCSNHPEQTTNNILEYALKNNFKRIVLTDHFWDALVTNDNKEYRDFYEIQKDHERTHGAHNSEPVAFAFCLF